MDFFTARYYGSAVERFISPDPANAGADATDPQSWNAYAYVRNNPLALVDPMGLCHIGADNVAYDDEPGDCGGGSVTVVASAPPDVMPIFVSLPSLLSVTQQPAPTAPPPAVREAGAGVKPPNNGTKQTFNQCMAAHANDFSIAGAVETGINALTGTHTRLRDNLLVGAVAGNSITTLFWGGAADNAAGAATMAPTFVKAGMGQTLSYGRRTADIMAINIAGKGGLPLALGQASSGTRALIGQVGDVLGLGLSFTQKLAIDAGFAEAEAAYCYATTK